MKVAAMIPIKLNNQRLPGKNTKLLGGKPLCQYLFETVRGIREIDEKYVYCSDEKIVPYLPEEIRFLKRDPCLDGFEVKGLQIIERFVRDVDADVYVLTHVTQPFTRRESIVGALRKVTQEGYDSAFSAVAIQDYCWYQGRPLNYDARDIVRTQDLTPVYKETGAFFIFRKEVFTRLGRRIGENPYLYEIDQLEAIDIDTEEDFKMARIAVELDV